MTVKSYRSHNARSIMLKSGSLYYTLQITGNTDQDVFDDGTAETCDLSRDYYIFNVMKISDKTYEDEQ